MAREFLERASRDFEPEEIDRLWERAIHQEGQRLTIYSAEGMKQIVELLP